MGFPTKIFLVIYFDLNEVLRKFVIISSNGANIYGSTAIHDNTTKYAIYDDRLPTL